MQTLHSPPHTHRRRISFRVQLVAMASSFAASDAFAAEWGTSNWGEFAWGDLLPAVPMLGLVGTVALVVAVLGLGAWLTRSAWSEHETPQD